MPIYKISQDILKNSAIYKFTDEDAALVNSLRRIILAEIPNIAFDPVNMVISTNTGNLHNEFLMHRISMIPIHANPSEFDDVCQIMFSLNVKNDTVNPINVTSADIRYDVNKTIGNLFPTNHITSSHILITRLLPGQEIQMKFKASIGISKDNTRWCPVSKCSFMNALDEEEIERQRAITTIDPSIFEAHHKYRIYKKNAFGEASEFIFYIDSECALTPDYMMMKAIEILIHKLENMSSVSKVKIVNNMVEVFIKDEDYTLVNMVQSYIYNTEIRDQPQNTQPRLQYIGYYKPHPLDNSMMLKLSFVNNDIPKNILEYIQIRNNVLIEKLKKLFIQ